MDDFVGGHAQVLVPEDDIDHANVGSLDLRNWAALTLNELDVLLNNWNDGHR